MNRNRRLLIIGIGIVITLVVAVLALRVVFNCCALPPRPFELTGTAIVSLNQAISDQLTATHTATPTSSPTALFPYDPTLYAQRRQEEMKLQTGAGPTQYAIFFATEAALIATYQGTVLPTFTPAIVSPTPMLPPTPPPYDATLYAQRRQEEERIKTNTGPIYTAEYFYATETALVATYQGTVLPSSILLTATGIFLANQAYLEQYYLTQTAVKPTATPFPYDATLYAQRLYEQDLLKTAGGPTEYAVFYATETALVATFAPSRTPTPTPTLCPYSDVICPGGNETLSPAGQVMLLMASASAPEFGQLARTATALAYTPTATATTPYVQCAWSWARQDLPDVTMAAQAAITEAGLENVMVRSEAYGEDCSDSATGKYMGFGAMSTDFYLTATVSDLDDKEALGQIVITAYHTLLNLDAKLPAQHGYLDIEFKEGSEVKRFRAMFSQLKTTIESQATGAEVLEAGGGLR